MHQENELQPFVRANNPWWAYGFLILIMGMLIRNINWLIELPASYPYERYGNIIISIMLILNHVAFSFTWRKPLNFVMYAITIAWMAFVFLYQS